MATIILITVLVVTFYLGMYAIREGQRIERNKRSGRSVNDPVSIWNQHKRKNNS